MRNPMLDWIGVILALLVSAVITFAAKRVADERLKEKL